VDRNIGVYVSDIDGVNCDKVAISPGRSVAGITVCVMIIARVLRVRVGELWSASFKPVSDSESDKLPRITAKESRAATKPRITWRYPLTLCLQALLHLPTAGARYK